ncbi:hypothetical protein U3516DRAFT_760412 [Neocallimastix sp. 'constans']|jgi:hypothetical protein
MQTFPHPILRRRSSIESYVSDSSDSSSVSSSVSSLSEKRVSFCETKDTYTMMSDEEYDRKAVPLSRLYYKDYCELRMMRMQMNPEAYIFEC